MADMADWIEKLEARIIFLGGTIIREFSGSNRQLWALGDQRIIVPNGLRAHDSGRVRQNVEHKAAGQIAQFLKTKPPGYEEALEKERKAKAKGMSPAVVDSWKPLGPKDETIEPMQDVPVVTVPTPVVEVPPVTPEPVEPDVKVEVEAEPVEASIGSLTDLPQEPPTLEAAAQMIPATEAEPFTTTVGLEVSIKEEQMPKGKPKADNHKPQTKCPWCEMKFKLPQGLGRHVTTMHPKEYPEYLEKYTKKTVQARAKQRAEARAAQESGLVAAAFVVPSPDRMTPSIDEENQLSTDLKALIAAAQSIAQRVPKLEAERNELARQVEFYREKWESVLQMVRGQEEHEAQAAKVSRSAQLQRRR
jgi:hypothetical protein